MEDPQTLYTSKSADPNSTQGDEQQTPRKDVLLSMIPMPGSTLYDSSVMKFPFTTSTSKSPSGGSESSYTVDKEPEPVVEEIDEEIEEQEEVYSKERFGPLEQEEQIDVKEFPEGEEIRKEIGGCQCECSKLLRTCFPRNFSASHILRQTTVKPKNSLDGIKPNDGIVSEGPLTQEASGKDEENEEAVFDVDGRQRLWISPTKCLVQRPHHDAYNRMKKLQLRKRFTEISTDPTEEEIAEERRQRLQKAIDETKEEVVTSLHKKFEKIFFFAKQQLNEEYFVRVEKYEKEFAVSVEDAIEIAKEKTKKKTETRFDEQLESLRRSMRVEYDSVALQEYRRIRDACDFVARATLRENEELYDRKYRKFVDACIEWLQEAKKKKEEDQLVETHASDVSFLHDLSHFIEAKFEAFNQLREEYRQIEDTWTAELQSKEKEIINMKNRITILSRDIAIRKGLIKEILSQYKQFTAYVIQKWPSKLEFPLSLDRLYQIHMDELFKEEKREALYDPPKETLSEAGRTRLSGFPSQSDMSSRGSSSCSELEEGQRKNTIVAHVVDRLIDRVIPSPQSSEEETRARRFKGTKWEWLTTKSTSRPLNMSVTTEDDAIGETSKVTIREGERSELKVVLSDESKLCEPVGDFTKKRIRDFKGLLKEKGDLLKPFIKKSFK